eukprot:11610198-Alexandrium_andersonii.AAC.1
MPGLLHDPLLHFIRHPLGIPLHTPSSPPSSPDIPLRARAGACLLAAMHPGQPGAIPQRSTSSLRILGLRRT